MRKGIFIIGSILILCVAVFFLTAKQEFHREDTDTIVLGFIAPLTGDASLYGEPKRNTVELAVAEINIAGGINGHLLEVLYEDGKCDGYRATQAAQMLIEAGVEIILGGFCSNESVSAEPITTEAEVFLFSAGSSSPDLTDVSPFFARIYPSDASQGVVLANSAYARGWRTVAFMQEQLDYPLGIYNTFRQRFTALGGSVISETFPTSQRDFGDAIRRLQQQSPDALFVDTQTSVAAARIIEEVSNNEWSVPLILSDSVAADEQFIAENAVALNGAIAALFSVDESNERFIHLEKSYEEQYGPLVYPQYMQTVYDAVHMVADALMAVGNDGEAVARWVREAEGWSGASGRVDIGKNGDRLGGHKLKVIRGGVLQGI